MGNLRELFKQDPTLLDRLIRLMAFVKEDEQHLGRKWSSTDWKCMEAVAHAKEKHDGTNT